MVTLMALLVVHNVKRQPCSLPARPELNFEDAKHQLLPISLRAMPGMHPGPVILPLVIPAKARATSQLHWVSSDVYGGNNCFSPAFITLMLGENILRTKFNGRLCGPAGKNPAYTVTLFKLN